MQVRKIYYFQNNAKYFNYTIIKLKLIMLKLLLINQM
jgi:hypothetical protein